MSINVNGNQNQIDLRKLMQARQSGKTGATARTQNKDPRMSMNGSIFGSRAQMVSGQQNSVNSAENEKSSVNNVANVNTSKAIGGLNSVTTTGSTSRASGLQGQEQKGFDLSNIDFDNLGTLSLSELQTVQNDLKSMVDGDAPFFLVKPFEQKLNKVNAEVKRRHEEVGDKLSEDNKKAEDKSNDQMISDAKNGKTEAEAGTRTTQKGTEDMKKMSSETESLEKDIKKEEKKLKKEEANTKNLLNKNTKAINQETKNIANLAAENEEIAAENETKQAEIDALTSSGDEGSQTRINDLQGQIRGSSAKLDVNAQKMGKSSVAITRYNAASNAKIRRLTKNAKTYTRTMATNQKQIESNQQESDKTLEVANKIENISQKIATVGTVTKYTGILLGKVPWTAAVGAYMEVTGTVAETAGNYGVCAANITKTAVNVAQGNITGALMSAGSAIMSGATAIGNTKQMVGAAKAAKAAGEQSKSLAQLAAKNAGKDAGKEMAKASSDLAKDSGLNGFVKNMSSSKYFGISATTKDFLQGVGKDGFKDAGKKLTEEITKYGGPLVAVGSAFGGMQQQQTSGVTQRRGIARAQFSNRRKIA